MRKKANRVNGLGFGPDLLGKALSVSVKDLDTVRDCI